MARRFKSNSRPIAASASISPVTRMKPRPTGFALKRKSRPSKGVLVYGLVAIATVGAIALGWRSVVSQFADSQKLQAHRGNLQQKTTAKKIEEEAANDRIPMAIPVLNQSGGVYASLAHNKPVYDSSTGLPIPPGVTLFDWYGSTGITVDDDRDAQTPAVIQSILHTGNRQLIENRFQQFTNRGHSGIGVGK